MSERRSRLLQMEVSSHCLFTTLPTAMNRELFLPTRTHPGASSEYFVGYTWCAESCACDCERVSESHPLCFPMGAVLSDSKPHILLVVSLTSRCVLLMQCEQTDAYMVNNNRGSREVIFQHVRCPNLSPSHFATVSRRKKRLGVWGVGLVLG